MAELADNIHINNEYACIYMQVCQCVRALEGQLGYVSIAYPLMFPSGRGYDPDLRIGNTRGVERNLRGLPLCDILKF